MKEKFGDPFSHDLIRPAGQTTGSVVAEACAVPVDEPGLATGLSKNSAGSSATDVSAAKSSSNVMSDNVIHQYLLLFDHYPKFHTCGFII